MNKLLTLVQNNKICSQFEFPLRQLSALAFPEHFEKN